MDERKTKFCVNCGAEIDARAEICPKCGVRVAPPPSPTPPAAEKVMVKRKPKLGLAAGVFGSLIVFISAIAYLATGNAVAGVLGIVLVVAAVVFLWMGYNVRLRKTQMYYGFVPLIIGIFLMYAGGSLLQGDFVVIIGGFLITVGGILITSDK